jgi:hypothetical protein
VTLEGFPTIAELRKKAEANPNDPRYKRMLEQLNMVERAPGQPARAPDPRSYGREVMISNGRVIVTVQRGIPGVDVEEASGVMDAAGGLRLVLPVTPRTKKNSRVALAKPSDAYIRMRNDALEILRLIAGALQLPLPSVQYNLAATFYVDAKGKNADLLGLLQAIADILETDEDRHFPGVVTNDKLFRAFDGSRIVEDDDRPRVELTITPMFPHPDV